MLFSVLSGFIYTVLSPAINKLPSKIIGWIFSILPLGIFVYFLTFYENISNGQVVRETYSWVSVLGADFSFYLDGLSLIFVLIISFAGFAVFLYAGSYLKGNSYLTRFYIYLLVFMASMLGLVLSDNLITLFIFWELTSISSYLLIGFYHSKEKSRKSALQALLVTGGGGLALMAGLILLGIISGSWSVSGLKELNEIILAHKYYPAAVILILIGAFTKSAQFPFHFWLPNAMEAPAPVSAYLHSATMVKAGIYLMARLNPALGGNWLWNDLLLFFGAVTMISAAMIAFRQTDLKKLLAYSTLSVLGTLTMLLGIGSDLAIKAFIIFLIAHSLYKGTLFMIAGIIDHKTGTRNIDQLGGLYRIMPVTALIAAAASLSKMGIIPLIGFIGKETVYASALEFTRFGYLFIALAIAANIFIVYITLATGFKPFWGNLKETPKKPIEAPLGMYFGPLILALGGFILGIFAPVMVGNLINNSEIGIIAANLNIPVKLWHGFNLELLLSFLTVLSGAALYYSRKKLIKIVSKLEAPSFPKPSVWYERLLQWTINFAGYQSRVIQNGHLGIYLFVILTAAFITVYYFAAENITLQIPEYVSMPPLYELIPGLLIAGASIMAVKSATRITSIVSVGIVGLSVAMIFILYSAPDLAITQFSIETLTVVLFVLVLYKLPKNVPLSGKSRRARDMLISVAGGAAMSMITLLIISNPTGPELKKYFSENSFPLGKGQNIVNVILVDFRALDTLGEITVLAVAAIGVAALLRKNRERERVI